jgi:hypothetical protein
MIVAWEEMAVAIHRDLQRRMTGKRLHRLGREGNVEKPRSSVAQSTVDDRGEASD